MEKAKKECSEMCSWLKTDWQSSVIETQSPDIGSKEPCQMQRNIYPIQWAGGGGSQTSVYEEVNRPKRRKFNPTFKK